MLRTTIKVLTILFSLLIIALVCFRFAAALRETQDLVQAYPAEGRVIETVQGRFFVQEQGPPDGTSVLLVHGSVGWAGFWRETVEALARDGYRAIAYDTPPMGYSDRDPEADYSRGAQAMRLLALVEALAVKPVLVAHSFGAGLATEAVMSAPDAFAGYVIVDGAIGVGSHDSGKRLPVVLRPQIVREAAVSATITNPLLSRTLLAAFMYRKDRAAAYVDVLRRPGVLRGSTAELARWLPELLVPPTEARSTRAENFRAMTLPVGIIWGAEDTTTPLSQGEELRDLIPGARLTVLPDVGHIPQIEDPEAFQEALGAVLKGL